MSKKKKNNQEYIEIIGAKPESINKAEDRELFKECMSKIGLESAKAKIAKNLEDAELALEYVGLPAIIRPSFTLGGEGGGIAYNNEEFLKDSELHNAIKTNDTYLRPKYCNWSNYDIIFGKNDVTPLFSSKCNRNYFHCTENEVECAIVSFKYEELFNTIQ